MTSAEMADVRTRSILVAMLLTSVILPALAVAVPTKRTARIPARNVHYLSRLHHYLHYSDVWGYTAPDGGEYALVGVQGPPGTQGGISVVDISRLRRPRETGLITRPEQRLARHQDFQPLCLLRERDRRGARYHRPLGSAESASAGAVHRVSNRAQPLHRPGERDWLSWPVPTKCPE